MEQERATRPKMSIDDLMAAWRRLKALQDELRAEIAQRIHEEPDAKFKNKKRVVALMKKTTNKK